MRDCHVAGGVSMEPERKMVGPVFVYGLGAIMTRPFVSATESEDVIFYTD